MQPCALEASAMVCTPLKLVPGSESAEGSPRCAICIHTACCMAYFSAVLDRSVMRFSCPADCCIITISCVQVEMYADPIARGGVLEPEGIVEIKFRVPDLLRAMHRLDPVIRGLKDEAEPDFEAQIKARETALLPVYRQVLPP